jgi:DNA repair photolyase
MHYVTAKGILSAKNGMNLYRGCQHGCIYCDSRSACYHMEHAFEDVEVKENAIPLLEDALCRKRKPCVIGMGSMTDPYIPLEEKLCHTRQALELLERYGFGATLITKSARVLRDMELLKKISEQTKCVVQMTLTTYDEALCRTLEPAVSTTKERFEALKALRDAGIPTVVWLCPILPFLNDTEENINGILDDCAEAGVKGVICFGMGMTLREGNREYFYKQLDRHFPGLKEEYIRRYGNAYMLDSPNSRELMKRFRRRCDEAGILRDNDRIFAYLNGFEIKKQAQLSLFDEMR